MKSFIGDGRNGIRKSCIVTRVRFEEGTGTSDYKIERNIGTREILILSRI